MRSNLEVLAAFLDGPRCWTPSSLRLLQETVATFPADAKTIAKTFGANREQSEVAAERVAEIACEVRQLIAEAVSVLEGVE